MITTWRIVRPEYADDAFEGKGARLHGGRWNPRGVSIVYTAGTVSLATLELLVGVRKAQRLHEYVLTSCSFPEVLMERLDRSLLPENWRDYPPPSELQIIGRDWASARSSAVLEVPSAVIDTESNYLLNPEHEVFRSIDLGQPRPFRLDFRLLT